MTTTEQRRAETLKLLHEDRWSPCLDLAEAVALMAIRYATARVLQVDRDLDYEYYELVDRARSRRFAAILRLVNALKRQS